MEPMNELLQVAVLTTTVESAEDAQQLAQAAVQLRLAACAQVEAIASHYVWQGQLSRCDEWRLVFKTLPCAVARLQHWLAAQHPYDVPQILLRLEASSAPYMQWLRAQVDQAPD